MFRNPGLGEVLVIIIAMILLFGSKRLPDLARSIGKSLGEFKKGREEGLAGHTDDEDKDETSDKKS